MIPQEPFIFTGSIIENVDPLQQYHEAEVWRALDACGARALVQARGGLSAPALPIARGHAQLLCLVRALLHKPKVTGNYHFEYYIVNVLYNSILIYIYLF